jgi:iron complex outermembrane receptor protein
MKGFLFSLFIGFTISISAQVDTTLQIEAVEISTTKIRKTVIGSQTQTYSTQQLQTFSARNIAELLQQESGVFIKTYGSGSLATSSMRGGNAGHTLVLWNDLPIQSPMLGLLDLSLLPTNLMDEISVQQGGGTAMWGSGAVGGVIALNNQVNFKNKIDGNTQTTFGSFGLFQQNLNVKIGNKKFQSHTKLSHQQADNDFTYFLAPDFSRVNENAQFQQQNFLQDFYFKFNKTQTFAAHFWLQQSKRQIPPTTVQVRSQAYQNDAATRLILDWKSVQNRYLLNSKVGFFKEKLDYFDDQIGLESPSGFTTLLGEFDAEFHINNNQKISLGTTHQLMTAEANNYLENPKEYRAALFANYLFKIKSWQGKITIRQEMVDGVFVPITPMFGIEKTIGKYFLAKAKVSRNYRLPTLNDRFWSPGGNIDLLAENGWSQEATLAFKTEQKQWKLDISSTGFNRNMNNWIMWIPLDNQAFWSANNITKVWSRGIENQLNFQQQIKGFRCQFSIGYNWIRSTNEIAIERPKIAANQQLFYTPEHQTFGNLKLNYQQFIARYSHQFTGGTMGLGENLSAYHIGNIQIGYQLKTDIFKGNILLNIQNIWNTEYFIVERRPMVGRSFNISFIVR